MLRREPQQLAILVFTSMLRFNSTKRLLEMETRTQSWPTCRVPAGEFPDPVSDADS